MSQVSTSPSMAALGVSAKPERRDIGLGRRYAAERRFRLYGMAAIAFGLLFLFLLLFSVVYVVINLLIDISYTLFDPRIRY